MCTRLVRVLCPEEEEEEDGGREEGGMEGEMDGWRDEMSMCLLILLHGQRYELWVSCYVL